MPLLIYIFGGGFKDNFLKLNRKSSDKKGLSKLIPNMLIKYSLFM